jgi:hypothetical protein
VSFDRSRLPRAWDRQDPRVGPWCPPQLGNELPRDSVASWQGFFLPHLWVSWGSLMWAGVVPGCSPAWGQQRGQQTHGGDARHAAWAPSFPPSPVGQSEPHGQVQGQQVRRPPPPRQPLLLTAVLCRGSALSPHPQGLARPPPTQSLSPVPCPSVPFDLVLEFPPP